MARKLGMLYPKVNRIPLDVDAHSVIKASG